MNTSAVVSKFEMSQFFMFKSRVLLKPVLEGRGRLFAHYGTVHGRAQSNRVCNISILPCCAFFRDSIFLCFLVVFYLCFVSDYEQFALFLKLFVVIGKLGL
jgi:hypothetical protein